MRLESQDQLTAIARFLDDINRRAGVAGHERARLALGMWMNAPSEPAWDELRSTVVELVGETDASWIVGDLEPYLRKPS